MRAVPSPAVAYAMTHLDRLDRARLESAGDWRPVRRALGVTSVGVNAYTAASAGDPTVLGVALP